MSKSEIQRSIRRYETLLSAANKELTAAREKLTNLKEFRGKFNTKVNGFDESIRERKSKNNIISSMTNNVKCAKRYYDKMNEMLNSKFTPIETKIAAMENDIANVITKTNSEISSLKSKIQSYERKIRELRRQLARCDD